MTATRISTLDKGFVELLNVAGPVRRPEAPFDAADTDPATTARISFGNMGEERTYEQDLKLCEYLIKNKHNTPIEMIETWWHMKLPIFVARQLVRHRTAAIGEISARYTTLPSDWYIPAPENVNTKSKSNKQGRSNDKSIEHLWFRESLNAACEKAYDNYLYAIDAGIAPELARLFLHVNHYTEWVFKIDLHNLMHLLALRQHSHAQYEARLYANAMYSLLHSALPGLAELYKKYRVEKEE